MPTVLRIGGARVVIFPDDHRPAHVHVIDAGRQAVFLLNCPTGPVQLRSNEGYSQPETNRLSRALAGVVGDLCAAWEAIHGDR